jgi:hypothetical protein
VVIEEVGGNEELPMVAALFQPLMPRGELIRHVYDNGLRVGFVLVFASLWELEQPDAAMQLPLVIETGALLKAMLQDRLRIVAEVVELHVGSFGDASPRRPGHRWHGGPIVVGFMGILVSLIS